MTFQELNLTEPLLRAVTEKGYQTPTPIQQQAIPPALAGRDLLGCAQTGTGKTAAFTLPILQHLAAEPVRGRRPIRALVLTPTRELAIQIDDCCRDYARHTAVRHAVIFGGVSQRPQVEELARGVDLLIATPGRLLDLIGQGFISLDAVRHFVLDEADRMLDMGFIHDIRRILPLLPARRQTLLFSATMPPEIERLAATILHDPVYITVTPPASVVETIRQQVLFVEKADKRERLTELLHERGEESVLVFSRTKHGADRIARQLTRAGIEARAIHGDKSQGARERALGDFRTGACRVLIATDIAARGIDIRELPLVVNFDLPEVAETYVHRIGRTGRAGSAGQALSFCAPEERELLDAILKLTGLMLAEQSDGTFLLEAQPAAPAKAAKNGRGGKTAAPAAHPHAIRPAAVRTAKAPAAGTSADANRPDPAAGKTQKRSAGRHPADTDRQPAAAKGNRPAPTAARQPNRPETAAARQPNRPGTAAATSNRSAPAPARQPNRSETAAARRPDRVMELAAAESAPQAPHRRRQRRRAGRGARQ
ncbi:DEAD/DEAH box helicase [uncultured Alistipes sp.]|uniref:DEAD/DEAH box helicase n=1 Tax=uncultured Alistipes sp. TaxID=538949 RepID=UPI0032088CEF